MACVFKKSFKSFILRPLIMIRTGQSTSLTNLEASYEGYLKKKKSSCVYADGGENSGT